MLETTKVLPMEEVRLRDGVRVPDRVDDTFAENKRVGVAVLVLVAVGVGDDVIFDVPVPVTLIVFEKEDVADDEAPVEILAVGDGVCEPVIVLLGDVVPEGVPVDDPVPEIVSELLIVSDGSEDGIVGKSLPESDSEAN